MENNLTTLMKSITVIDLELRAAAPGNVLRFKCDLLEILSDERIVISMPILNGKFLPLEVGRPVTIAFYDGDAGICSFSGVVVNRVMDPNHPMIHIEKRSMIHKTQRRNYYRMSLVMDAKVKIAIGTVKEKVINNGVIEEIEETEYKNIPILIKDLSGGGLRAVVYEYIQTETELSVVLSLDKDLVELPAKVVRCFQVPDTVVRYDLGLQFGDIDERDRNRIISYIYEKQRNIMKKGLV